MNALEKAMKVVQALQELEQQWGLTKSHPYFMPGFFSLLPGVFYSDPGLPIPFYFMELLVGFVQALVFMLLTAVFTLLICQHEEEAPAAAHAR